MQELTTSRSLQDKADEIPDKTEAMGGFIDQNVIMQRNTATGGCLNEILGPQGSGKTSLMLNYACRIMRKYPEEIIIWRDSYQSACQFNRIKNWEIFAEIGTELEFKDVEKESIVDVPITIFKDFKDLRDKMKPQQLNVVYVKEQVIGYITLINFLKTSKGWQSIFIDEYEDIAPINSSGDDYRFIMELGREMKNIRKGLVSLFCNTQSKTQIDWRVRTTFMVKTYLSGARRDKGTSIWQESINKLEKGVAWVNWEGKYGRINYPAFKPKQPILIADDLNRVSSLDKLIAKQNQKKIKQSESL